MGNHINVSLSVFSLDLFPFQLNATIGFLFLVFVCNFLEQIYLNIRTNANLFLSFPLCLIWPEQISQHLGMGSIRSNCTPNVVISLQNKASKQASKRKAHVVSGDARFMVRILVIWK